MRERKRQSAKAREIRPAAKRADDGTEPATGKPERDELDALKARIEHLEALVQGLQDSVHRETTRHDKQIAGLEARIQPQTLGKALSEDARARGL